MTMDTSRLRFPKGLPRIALKMIKARLAEAEERRVRAEVHQRDQRRCFFPACRRRATDLHHIRPRSVGGMFRSRNLISACRQHHGWFHAGLIRVTGNPDHQLRVSRTLSGRAAGIRIPKRVAA